MSKTYKVAWPYATVKVLDKDTGATVLREFYAGGIVPDNADPEDVKRLVRKGVLVEEGSPEAEFAVPAGTPVPEKADEEPKVTDKAADKTAAENKPAPGKTRS